MTEFIQVQHASRVKLKQLSLQLEFILSLARQLILLRTLHMLDISKRFVKSFMTLCIIAKIEAK